MRTNSLLAVTLCTALLSCGPPPTEIVVRVTTDLSQGMTGAISHVDIRVRYESSSTTNDRGFDLAGTPTQPNLPQDLGILPHNGNTSESVIVEVTATSFSGPPLLVQTARVHFDPGHIVLLEVPLSGACIGAACGAMMFCGVNGTCSSWDRDPLPRADDIASTSH